jgi:hypothetical protein
VRYEQRNYCGIRQHHRDTLAHLQLIQKKPPGLDFNTGGIPFIS